MKSALILIAALIFQIPSTSPNDNPIAAPTHLHYQRPITLAPGTTGQVCTFLDATIFAHAASASLNDLRLYAQSPSGTLTETPFNLSVNDTQTSEDDTATILNLGTFAESSAQAIAFDLVMPTRVYSTVALKLNAQNFVGTATVIGSSTTAAPATDLGTFTVFDLTAQHLSHSTTLTLQESNFRTLHITLHLHAATGTPAQIFPPSIVSAVSIPPSRQAQTLYTTVATVDAFSPFGRDSLASVHVPAHVPIERVAFTINPALTANFSRPVQVSVTPIGGTSPRQDEAFTGEISHVQLSSTTDSALLVDSLQTTIDTPVATNLHTDAAVRILVPNGDDKPLPITAAQVQMRQREVCFEASPDANMYQLMYGDDALHAPIYDYARLFTVAAHPTLAPLAAEQPSPHFTLRQDTRPFTERHPELLWIVLLAVIAILGSMVLRSARSRNP